VIDGTALQVLPHFLAIRPKGPTMKLIEGLLLLLVVCVIAGIVRKLRGGTFLPPPGSDGDHHVQDRSGHWWRYNAADPNTVEQVLPRKKARKS
jgi:hypothetical protein